MSVTFNPDTVRLLAEILRDTGLTEIEITDKSGGIRVVRAPAVAAASAPISIVASAPVTAPVSTGSASAPIAAPFDDAQHPGAITSPMVGVAYLSPEPGAASFVTLGQTVSVGQTLMLIEAMKTFNQIKAVKAGTVSRIIVESGAPVEFGEPLMIVE